MALVNCSECGKKVSEKAHSCPNCGNPIAAGNVTTIQQTAKILKANIIIGVIMIFAGFIRLFAMISSGDEAGFSYVLIIAGTLWVIFTKTLIWWRHN